MKLTKPDLLYRDCEWWLRTSDMDCETSILYIDIYGTIGYDTIEVFSNVNYGYCFICTVI